MCNIGPTCNKAIEVNVTQTKRQDPVQAINNYGMRRFTSYATVSQPQYEPASQQSGAT